MSDAGTELEATKKIQDFQVQTAELENHLRAVKGHFETVSRLSNGRTLTNNVIQIDCHEAVEEVYESVRRAVERFLQHAEAEK